MRLGARGRKGALGGKGWKKGQELWAVLPDRGATEDGDHGPVVGQWGAMEGSGER